MQGFPKYFFVLLFTLFSLNALAQHDKTHKFIQKELKSLLRVSKKEIKKENKRSQDLREKMEKILGELNLDRELIFGPDDLYFAKGMHLNFIKEPKPMQTYVNRDENIILLENIHIELYVSDKNLYFWQNIDSNLKKLFDDIVH